MLVPRCRRVGHPFWVRWFACLVILAVCGSKLAAQADAGNEVQPPQLNASIVVSPATASLGLGSTMQFSAALTGLTGGVTWQVNGVTGGAADSGTVDSTGLYFAPAAAPVSPVVITALGSDNVTAGSAQISLLTTDPLGTVNSSTTISCGKRKLSGTCYKLNISCSGLPDANAYVFVSNPSGTISGSAMFLTGGGASTLYEQVYTYGTTALNAALDAGIQVSQVTFGSPFQSNVPDGWLTGSSSGGGPRKAACRPSTVARWIHDNLANPAKPFCGTGNSAGGQALAYAISYYGLDSMFAFIEPTGGPPFARLDWGCESNQPKVYSSCPNLTIGYSIGKNAASSFIDPSYGDSRCSDAVTTHSTANGVQFLADSLAGGGVKTNFPGTVVKVLFGGKDTGTTQNEGMTWVQSVTSAISTSCISDAAHNMPSTLDAAQQIGADLVSYCAQH